MLSVKQGGIKYHFLSLWYDSTRDVKSTMDVKYKNLGEHLYNKRKLAV